jgi:4-oxalocrotonate tautomerase
MPYVNVRIAKGAVLTREKKLALVEGITRVLVDTLDKRPENTHIVIDEIDPDNWGVAGMLVTDFRNLTTRS